MDILEKLEKGHSAVMLAGKYDVSKSTISMLRTQSSKIREFVKNTEAVPRKRKTLKASEMPKMEDALYSWVCKQRYKHAVISTSLLCEKALQLNNVYGESKNFAASRGWVEKFRKRHGIRFLKVTGEKLSNNPDLVEPFLKEFQSALKRLCLLPEQVYNADETGLFWRLLPDKTLVLTKESSAPGRKSSKERLTFLACTNATGTHKLKPLVIGKAQNPRAFKGYILPVHYKASRNAWMTKQIFLDWFKKSFIPEVREFLEQQNLPKRALLLLDNAACHPSADELFSSDGLISVMFFPPNVTALIQPMDQNVINLTKLYYKKMLLSEVVSSNEIDISKAIKQVTLRHAIKLLSQAWEKVSPASIEKCWKSIMPKKHWEAEDDIPLSILQTQIKDSPNDMQELRDILEVLQGGEKLCDADIEAWIHDNQYKCGSESEISEVEPQIEQETIPISHGEAIKCANILLDWANENNLDIPSVKVLQDIKETALKKSVDAIRQTKITNYFTKM